MDVEVFADAATVAQRAAGRIAEDARAAIAARGQFTLAVSGGHTPWQMLRVLAGLPLDWARVHLFQVDERVAPDGDPDRNLTHIRDEPARARAAAGGERARDAGDRARSRRGGRATTRASCSASPAARRSSTSCTWGSARTDTPRRSCRATRCSPNGGPMSALTAPYQGHPRMTLTYPVLDRARRILFVATGAEKVAMVRRLRAGDPTIPAGRVDAARASLYIDAPAAGASA